MTILLWSVRQIIGSHKKFRAKTGSLSYNVESGVIIVCCILIFDQKKSEFRVLMRILENVRGKKNGIEDKSRWVCPALHFFQKYVTPDYEPAIFGKVIQKSHGFIIFKIFLDVLRKSYYLNNYFWDPGCSVWHSWFLSQKSLLKQQWSYRTLR